MSFHSGQRTHPQCSVSCKKNHCARWLSKVEASRGGPIKIISIEDHTGFVLISPAVSDLVVGSINASQKRLALSRRHWFGDLLKERPIRPGEKDGGDEQPRWRIYLGTAHPKGETVNVPKGLVSYGKTIKRVLFIEYRLLPPTRSSRLANSLLPRWTSPRLSGYTYPLSQGSIFSPFLATRLSETSPMPSHGTSPTPSSHLSHHRQDLSSPHLGRNIDTALSVRRILRHGLRI